MVGGGPEARYRRCVGTFCVHSRRRFECYICVLPWLANCIQFAKAIDGFYNTKCTEPVCEIRDRDGVSKAGHDDSFLFRSHRGWNPTISTSATPWPLGGARLDDGDQ